LADGHDYTLNIAII